MGREHIKICVAVAGLWTLNVEQLSAPKQDIFVRVTTFQKDRANPSIRAQTETYYGPEKTFGISVTVKKGEYFVLGATVKVKLTGKYQAHALEFDALDTGTGDDTVANDGIYTYAVYVKLYGGRYAVRADVYNLRDATLLAKNNTRLGLRKTSRLLGTSMSKREQLEKKSTSDDNVTDLVSYGGSFRLESDINETDFKPHRVRDLKILRHTVFSNGSLELHLSWTSMGAYGTSKTASRTELRISEDYEVLLTNFSSAVLIWNCEVIQGSLEPLPPFKNQTVVILLPTKRVPWLATNPVIYLKHRSYNKEGKASKLSNTVILDLEGIAKDSSKDKAKDSSKDSPKDSPNDSTKDCPKDSPKDCPKDCPKDNNDESEDRDDLDWVRLAAAGIFLAGLAVAAMLLAAYFVSHRKTNEETETK